MLVSALVQAGFGDGGDHGRGVDVVEDDICLIGRDPRARHDAGFGDSNVRAQLFDGGGEAVGIAGEIEGQPFGGGENGRARVGAQVVLHEVRSGVLGASEFARVGV